MAIPPKPNQHILSKPNEVEEFTRRFNPLRNGVVASNTFLTWEDFWRDFDDTHSTKPIDVFEEFRNSL